MDSRILHAQAKPGTFWWDPLNRAWQVKVADEGEVRLERAGEPPLSFRPASFPPSGWEPSGLHLSVEESFKLVLRSDTPFRHPQD